MTGVRLSKRMKAVADMVDENSVADIGCDHAYVSIYLLQKKITNKVIAMDVVNGPLDIAKSNIASCGLNENIDIRLSNGFDALEQGEVECAIIAGMGGMLIVNILKAGKIHTDNGIHLILQPQSDIDEVRKYLIDIGYTIKCEHMLIDEDKYYTIIKAIPAIDCVDTYSECELVYGKYLLSVKDEVLKAFLEHSKKKNRDIYNKLVLVNTDKSKMRILELENELRVIEDALKYYE